jgi:hypothetical protein
MAEAAKEKPEEKPVKPAGGTYVCKTKCFWNGMIYNPGDKVEYKAGIPDHFVKA